MGSWDPYFCFWLHLIDSIEPRRDPGEILRLLNRRCMDWGVGIGRDAATPFGGVGLAADGQEIGHTIASDLL